MPVVPPAGALLAPLPPTPVGGHGADDYSDGPRHHDPRAMRVISLSDGRICYLKPARPKTELPPGQTLAIANIRGERRFAVPVPEGWAAMAESELRAHAERALRAGPGRASRPGVSARKEPEAAPKASGGGIRDRLLARREPRE